MVGAWFFDGSNLLDWPSSDSASGTPTASAKHDFLGSVWAPSLGHVPKTLCPQPWKNLTSWILSSKSCCGTLPFLHKPYLLIGSGKRQLKILILEKTERPKCGTNASKIQIVMILGQCLMLWHQSSHLTEWWPFTQNCSVTSSELDEQIRAPNDISVMEASPTTTNNCQKPPTTTNNN